MSRTLFVHRLIPNALATALILFSGSFALAQSNHPTEAELDAVERRLIEHYNMREGPVAMRDLPEWAPIKKIVVRDIYGPGSLETTEARLDWISKVAPGVQFVSFKTADEAGIHICIRSRYPLDTIKQQRRRALLLQ
jgi:hypothetical protein